MSFLIARPDALATATTDLNAIGSGMAAQNAATAAATTHLSDLAATQFSDHAAIDPPVGAQPMAVHELLIAILQASAGSYAATETANAIPAC